MNQVWKVQALARDQLRALQEMTEGIFPDLQMGVYDGDTLQDERLKLRDNARIVCDRILKVPGLQISLIRVNSVISLLGFLVIS